MANIVMLTHWTGGEVYPYIRIGRRLRQRGHAVTLITHCIYADAARQAGLAFAARDTPEDWALFLQEGAPRLAEQLNRQTNSESIYEQVQDDPYLFKPEQLRHEYELVKQHCRQPDTILVARHGSGGTALLVAEELDIPIVSMRVAPAVAAQDVMTEALAGDVLLAQVNDARATLGFAPVRTWGSWTNAVHRNIGLWPEWFGPAEPTWPRAVTLVGFPLDKAATATIDELPAEIQGMVRRGERPVLISAGTGKLVRTGFYVLGVEACRLLGCSTVVACQYRDMLPDDLPEHIKWFPYLPFEKILPFMGTIIHHGGIGTIAEATLAGIPQLVLASGMDRPDNAERLKRLGVAEALLPIRWKPELIAEALRSLAAPAVRERCSLLAQWLREDDSLSRAAEVIESALHDPEAHLCGADFLAESASAVPSGHGGEARRTEQEAVLQGASPASHAGQPVADKLANLSPEQLALLMRRLGQKKKQGATP